MRWLGYVATVCEALPCSVRESLAYGWHVGIRKNKVVGLPKGRPLCNHGVMGTRQRMLFSHTCPSTLDVMIKSCTSCRCNSQMIRHVP